MQMDRYPFHTMLNAGIKATGNRMLINFLEHLAEHGLVICEYHETRQDPPPPHDDSELRNAFNLPSPSLPAGYYPIEKRLPLQWLCEMFEVDYGGLMKEKDRLLDEIRGIDYSEDSQP